MPGGVETNFGGLASRAAGFRLAKPDGKMTRPNAGRAAAAPTPQKAARTSPIVFGRLGIHCRTNTDRPVRRRWRSPAGPMYGPWL